MTLYALQIRKNDRWVYCTHLPDRRIIVSMDRNDFTNFGPQFRVIEFPGLIDNHEWINSQTSPPYENPTPNRYSVVVNEEWGKDVCTSQPEILSFEVIRRALAVLESSPDWHGNAVITMNMNHRRALLMLSDTNRCYEVNLGAPDTLFGYPVEIKPDYGQITIKLEPDGVIYTLF